ncbi:MAG: hypothetical protein AB7O26_18510 [Planctomycetaceae bacterium]
MRLSINAVRRAENIISITLNTKGHSMSSSSETFLVDAAREWISTKCADLLREGSCHIRVRVMVPNGEPTGALIYRRDSNHWNRTDHSVDGAELAAAVRSVVQMLASHPPTDAWNVRYHSASDFEDLDLQFHREAVEAHTDDQLRSWVSGVLFKDPRASRQDRRTAPQRGGGIESRRQR